jgi:uncharacterized phage-like protein YoqJ
MQIPLFTEPTILAVTGHRPAKLGGYSDDVNSRLCSFARAELVTSQPLTVITGMALGWDQAIARACVDLGIPFVAAVPFDGQESRWPPLSRAAYRALVSLAAEVVVVSPSGFATRKAMHRRNQYMVDRGARVLALWDGSSGGTGHCVGYAITKRKPIDNCWTRWTRWTSTT